VVGKRYKGDLERSTSAAKHPPGSGAREAGGTEAASETASAHGLTSRTGLAKVVGHMEPSNRFTGLRLALLTDALAPWGQEQAFAWCADHGITALELGAGGYSPAPHLELGGLLASESERSRLLARVTDQGLEIVALNASGNPLHPDSAIAGEHDQALRGAIELAEHLDVPRVVAMSGCPGGPGAGSWPVFAGGAWLPDMEGLFQRQWDSAIAPYWSKLSTWAARRARGVDICLELHPGTSVYNYASFELLSTVTLDNVKVNLDPSHFWWQGIDPITTIRALGSRVGFVHGKDTRIYPERVALHGVLDFRWPSDPDTMPWHFCAVGHGRPTEDWRRLLEALRDQGYDGPVSIEHEDPTLTPEEGIQASLQGLRAAMEGTAPQYADG
jgi:sugar phosphate isomerase/epimerase